MDRVGTLKLLFSEFNGWPGLSPVERFTRFLEETGA
jgi:hypothetical protein